MNVPKEARDYIQGLKLEANAHPTEIDRWKRLGEAASRAAVFDPSYYAVARQAYARALALGPDDSEALRGAGNIDYDQQRYDEAIAAYEHYLRLKPDDPDVRTDLGTMYLSTGNATMAVGQYRAVLAGHPDFFQARFNLAVAYLEEKKLDQARRQARRALALAPNEQARSAVTNFMTGTLGEPAQPEAGAAPSKPATTAKVPGSAASSSADDAAAFRSAIEHYLRQMPVVGAKVEAVRWPSPLAATVLTRDFPMDRMPPFARAKFIDDVKSGISAAKSRYRVEAKVVLQIADAASGRVMETVSE